MTVSEIAKKLTDAGIESSSAIFEARLLVSHFMNKSAAQILADREADYDSPELIDAVGKRMGRYPLQYIIGEWEFFGLPIKVNENCLIPRPDTEVTAEYAIGAMPQGAKYLDLCTGSGCIAAAVMHNTRERSVSGYAVELCHGTAELARENIALLGLSDICRVIEGDASVDLFPGEYFDVITANPPYISEEEMSSLEEELIYEPRIALTDGGDGLSLIRAIIEVWGEKLADGGKLIIEHGWKQGEAVCDIAHECGMKCTPIKDLSGNTRAAVLCR